MNNTAIIAQDELCAYDFINTPDAMQALRQYVPWRKGAVKVTGKFKKIPLNPDTLRASDPHAPANWLSFDEAVAAYQQGKCDGIGLVLTGKPMRQADGTDLYLTCIDLDAAVRAEEAENLYERLGRPWVEVSPSGMGWHLWMWCRVPLKGGNAGNGRELYQSRQFVTVTGAQAKGQLIDATGALLALHAEWFGHGERSQAIEGEAAALEGAPRGPDVLTMALTHANYPPRPGTPEEIARVRDMLQAVSPDCSYEQWRNVCWSVRSTGWDCAEELVREWSMGCPERFDEEAFNSVMASYQPGRGITLGTLVHLAKQSGWTPTVQPSAMAMPGGSAAGLYEDMLNAREFATQWRGKLLHVPTHGGWLRWADVRWKLCQGGEEVEAAKAVSQRLATQALQVMAVDPVRGRQLMNHATASHKLSRLEAMVQLAKSEGGMQVPASVLDADPMLLGVGNGVVDLRTGALLPNRPELYVTRFCNANYDTRADCPRWLRFLDQVFSGDVDTIEAVQRLLGYTLTGLNTEEIMVIAYGHGANGKSVFGNVVHFIMGEYSTTAASSILVARAANDTGPRDDLAALAGARHVSINELQSGDRLDERTVKVLAGRERIAARHLYGRPFEFVPSFTAWLRTNHKPIIHGTDEGIWRRIALLPFLRQFAEHERDPHLETKLLAERDGILSWMVEGAVKYLRDGLKPSPAMTAERNAYRSDSDLLGQFLADRTQQSATARVEQSVLYEQWKTWCWQEGVGSGAKASFTRRLKERGYADAKSNGARFYTGLQLR